MHEIISRECGKYDLDDVRAKTKPTENTVKKEVVPFFEGRRCVEITALTMTGGLTFDNPAIQKAIDDAAQQSQLKVAEQMKLDAQSVTNKRLLSEADGRAAAGKREAQGKADAEVVEAEGKAKANITEKPPKPRASGEGLRGPEFELQKIKADPVTYLTLKRFEVELRGFWNGGAAMYRNT